MKEYLEIGKIVKPFGLSGEIKVYPWCDDANLFESLDKIYFRRGQISLNISSVKIHKSMVILRLESIDTIEDAKSLVNKIIYINRNQIHLEEGQFFIQDLIGLRVIDVDSKKLYGAVTQVYKTGANDVYEIIDQENKKYMIPVIPEVVKKVDLIKGTISINPMKGIFQNEV